MFARVLSNLNFLWFSVCLFVVAITAGTAFVFAGVLLVNHSEILGFLAFLLLSAVLGKVSYGMLVFLALHWNRLRRRGQMSRTPERIVRVLAKILDKFLRGI